MMPTLILWCAIELTRISYLLYCIIKQIYSRFTAITYRFTAFFLCPDSLTDLLTYLYLYLHPIWALRRWTCPGSLSKKGSLKREWRKIPFFQGKGGKGRRLFRGQIGFRGNSIPTISLIHFEVIYGLYISDADWQFLGDLQP